MLYLQGTTFIGFSRFRLLRWKLLFPPLHHTILIIYGIHVLDIPPKTLYPMHRRTFPVYLPSMFLKTYIPAKDVRSAKYTIGPFCPLIKELLVHSPSFTQ